MKKIALGLLLFFVITSVSEGGIFRRRRARRIVVSKPVIHQPVYDYYAETTFIIPERTVRIAEVPGLEILDDEFVVSKGKTYSLKSKRDSYSTITIERR